jgi:hypothetical protein
MKMLINVTLIITYMIYKKIIISAYSYKSNYVKILYLEH